MFVEYIGSHLADSGHPSESSCAEMEIESGGTSFEWGALPPELLQVMGRGRIATDATDALGRRSLCKNSKNAFI